MLENTDKPCSCADVKIYPDVASKGIIISAELPGVKKEDIRLNFTKKDFCLSGEREDLTFDCCYQLPCTVNYQESDATFENGMLTIKVPVTEAFHGEPIPIH